MPLHLRNAPTEADEGLGYGKGYRYAHDEADGVAPRWSACRPAHAGRRFYEPMERGMEIEIKRKLDAMRKKPDEPPVVAVTRCESAAGEP